MYTLRFLSAHIYERTTKNNYIKIENSMVCLMDLLIKSIVFLCSYLVSCLNVSSKLLNLLNC